MKQIMTKLPIGSLINDNGGLLFVSIPIHLLLFIYNNAKLGYLLSKFERNKSKNDSIVWMKWKIILNEFWHWYYNFYFLHSIVFNLIYRRVSLTTCSLGLDEMNEKVWTIIYVFANGYRGKAFVPIIDNLYCSRDIIIIMIRRKWSIQCTKLKIFLRFC